MSARWYREVFQEAFCLKRFLASERAGSRHVWVLVSLHPQRTNTNNQGHFSRSTTYCCRARFQYFIAPLHLKNQNHQLQQAMARGGADAAGEGADELPYGHGDPYRELSEVRCAEHAYAIYTSEDAWQSVGGHTASSMYVVP